jgi:hypothetical protein
LASERPVPPLEADPSPVQRLRDLVALIASLVALLLVALGIAALAVAILAAWSLYSDPAGIAPHVEHFRRAVPAAAGSPETLEGLGTLVAWVFVVLMLLLLGKLGSWAVGAAGLLLKPARQERPR